MTGPVPTDPDDTDLIITRIFNAPRDLVFRFWTDPDHLAKWWGPAGFHNPREDVEIDCRVGGRFRMRMVQSDTGTEFWVHADVVEFVEPEILALRFAPIPEIGIPSVTTRVQFHDHGDKTRITLREGPTATEQREYTAAGWSESLDKLDQLLSVDRKAHGGAIVMSDENEFQMPTPDPALKKLDFLVGRWQLTGTTVEGPTGPAAELSGVETFEWMEGGFFLVHHWKGAFDMAGEKMVDTGYEFFDYDPATQKYRAHFFNNLGPYDEAGSKYEGEFDGGALVVVGPARITRKLNGDGSITYDGDLPGEEGKGWTPWMHARLTKTS